MVLFLLQTPVVEPTVKMVVWESPLIVGGLITLALAVVASLQLLLVNRQQASLIAASELRAAAIRKDERDADYARQDEVAKRAETAAALLLEAQTATAVRQDEVAAKAADAAELLRIAQAESIARTDEVARIAAAADARVQEQLKSIDDQGKKIHILVNNDMTVALTAQRHALSLLILSLKDVLVMRDVLNEGRPTKIPSMPSALSEIEHVEQQIVELDRILDDRKKAQAFVDAEAAK